MKERRISERRIAGPQILVGPNTREENAADLAHEEATRITDQQYIDAARRLHGKDGECEIDEPCVVSRSSDGGAYVQAWVWVYDEDVAKEIK